MPDYEFITTDVFTNRRFGNRGKTPGERVFQAG